MDRLFRLDDRKENSLHKGIETFAKIYSECQFF